MEKPKITKDQNLELPLVALIGPTNAGKSTLFNRLTGSWQAVTAKEISTTRDRVYGEVEWQSRVFNLVDTGGLVQDESALYHEILKQTQAAIAEADLLLFVYDAAEGLSDTHKEFLNKLRGQKPLWLVANKVDSINRENKVERLPHLGLPYYEVSATSGRGSGDLLEAITKDFGAVAFEPRQEPLIALIGRPNVGKSSLLNALTQRERAVVSPLAGTTRDIVTERLELKGRSYLLADTAGIRRRGKIEIGAEKFSVKRALTAIAQADAVLVLVDAAEGTTRGDLHLIYYARELEKPVLVIFNKIDLVEEKDIRFHHHLDRFEHLAISALKQTNIDKVAQWVVDNIQKSRTI